MDSSKFYIDFNIYFENKKLVEVDVNRKIIELNRLNYKINKWLLR